MTRDEAIIVLKDFNKQVTSKADGAYQSTIVKMACKVAVADLEEIQQYRALGTVRQIKDFIVDWRKCRELGNLKELREAMEKQRAKKPIRIDMCTCPKCGTYNETVKKRRNTVNQDIVYCWHCGQAIEVKRSKEE